jgi:predicted ATPase/class 3 adenylate cyclase
VEPEPASGTLIFLFTDVEGSTRLWERLPQAMKAALERHDRILQAAVAASNGQVVKTTGDGMMAIFASAAAAVRACLTVQRDLAAEPWEATGALRVRMGLHAGEAAARSRDYFGPAVNRTARIMAVGHGGQVLLSSAAAALVADQLPDGAGLRDLGVHRLKDLGRPERLFQLVHPDLADGFPPLTTLDRRPNNLPTQTSTFVGRDAELEEIGRRLEHEAVRLLTLTGPGGTGKTRLALRAAADEIDRFEDGVFFVDLSAVRETEAVPAGIAQAIGLSETSRQGLVEELKGRLRQQHTLLVLDNFEQVTTAAPMAVELLEDCRGLKLLVTSREALRVRAEHLYPVPPLSLPRAVSDRRSAAELAGCEAVQLFVDRAQAVRADFRLTEDNAGAVADICRRLDGLPLAIELATARLNLFSPEALRDRLGSRLRLLRGGARDLPARQQTLRATLDWSHDLLDAAEQRLLARLAVFAGGCTLAAAEAVGDTDGDPDSSVLDALTGLVANSLLYRDDQHQDPHGQAEGAEPAEGSRLWLLETVREYAWERLQASGQADATSGRHAAYFLALAEQAWPELWGADQQRWYARLDREHDNLRAALAWAHAERDSELLVRLAGALGPYWEARGQLSEAHRWLDAALATEPVSPGARALNAKSRLLLLLEDDVALALPFLEEALILFQGLNDARWTVVSTSHLASALRKDGQHQRADARFDESSWAGATAMRGRSA